IYFTSSAAVTPSTAHLLDIKDSLGELDRESKLTANDTVFDFLNPPPTAILKGNDGRLILAQGITFPAVINLHTAFAVGFMNPCALNTPHTHPRATEFFYLIEGEVQTGLYQENGANFTTHQLRAGMATVFPLGGIHFQYNLSCKKATFIAAFNSEDPGVQTTAVSLFRHLPVDVIVASLAGKLTRPQVVALQKSILEALDNPSQGLAECRKRCNI
ncbi:unnamed protein product, partial [Didymodactylos carnosus]